MRGLLIDYGGVLTSNLFESFSAFCTRYGLEPEAVAMAFRKDRDARRALVAFECGRLEDAAFERVLAERLGIEPEGIIHGLFGSMRLEAQMVAAVAALKSAGVRTGLLSNSWGANGYDRTGWEDLFDVTVISGELGIRKPDPAIYALAAERLGVAPEETVFVDDLAQNLPPAEDLGMRVVHHRDPQTTIAELSALYGIGLG